MDIIYNRDTLYVYIEENDEKYNYDKLEEKVDAIMDSYAIEKLVISTKGDKSEHVHDFEWNYNKRHKNRAVVKQGK